MPNGGFRFNLARLRLVSIVAPVAFLAAVEALTIFALGYALPNPIWRFLVGFMLIAAGAVPFAVWVFRVIERDEREALLAAVLVDSVSDHAIFMLDLQGCIASWSKGAERNKGFTTEDVMGKPFRVLYTPDDANAGLPERNLETARQEGSTQYEGWRIRKDGSVFWADVVLTSVRDADGSMIGFSVVSRDVTRRRQAQDQIERLNEELRARVAELGGANDQIEHRNRQLTAVNDSIVAISSALDPSEVLQRIVDSARDLVDARYGALGVAAEDGAILQFITSGITNDERATIGPLPKGHGLLGVLIHDKEPLRLRNIQEHPGSVGFPANHPPMHSLLGVPIMYQGIAIGDLYMTEKRGAEEFSQEDQQVLELLANHAAVAITNARLYDESRRARNELERWSQHLESEVRKRTVQIEEQSHEMTGRILQAQEEERKRIARELHDETAQSLSTLLINIDLLELQLTPEDGRLRAGMERLRILAQRTLDETRALSHALRPTILDDVGLVAAVRWFVEELSRSFGAAMHVRVSGDEMRLDPEVELALFRIAQESLNNARKYSKANAVELILAFSDTSVTLTVEDDGAGFDASSLTGPTRQGGLGLYGMQERADLIDASLTIDSEPGRGTTVSVSAPAHMTAPELATATD